MKLDLQSRYHIKKRPALAGLLGVTILIFSLGSFSTVQGYEIIIDNNVDSDSNIDATANIGTDGATDYTDAQDQDDTDQTLIEADNGGAGTNEWVYIDTDAGTYSDVSTTGTPPYLDTDPDNSHYITFDKTAGSAYWYGFDSTSGSGSGFVVNISVYIGFNIAGDGNDDLNWNIDYTGDSVSDDSGTFTNPTDSWYNTGTISGLDTDTEINQAQLQLTAAGSAKFNDFTVETGRLGVSQAGGVDYQLNWEHSISSVDTDKDFFVVTVYGQATGGDSETFSIYLWDLIATDWTDTGQDIGTSETWYNWTLTVGFADCIGSTMYINYRSNTDGSDTTQSTCNIDYAGIRAFNFSTYGLPDFNSLIVDPDSSYHAFVDSPISFVVESGMTYNIQLKGTDLTLTPITDGYIYFNTVDNSGTSTQLTTSFQDLYLSQAIGNNTHLIYLWVNIAWTPGDAGITQGLWEFTLEISVTGA